MTSCYFHFKDKYIFQLVCICANWCKFVIQSYNFYALSWIYYWLALTITLLRGKFRCQEFPVMSYQWAFWQYFVLLPHMIVNSLHMPYIHQGWAVLTAVSIIIFHPNTCVQAPHGAKGLTGCVCCSVTGYKHKWCNVLTNISQWMEVNFFLSSILRQQQLLWPTYQLVNRHTLSHTHKHSSAHTEKPWMTLGCLCMALYVKAHIETILQHSLHGNQSCISFMCAVIIYNVFVEHWISDIDTVPYLHFLLCTQAVISYYLSCNIIYIYIYESIHTRFHL